jgi:hypothetical protein
MKKFGILLIVLVAFSGASIAQNTVTKSVDATAKIIAPITLTKTGDLNFGSIIPGAAASNVVLSADAAATVTPDGTTRCIGTPTNAKFDVTGEASTTYKIDYPTTVNLTKTGAPTMIATISCSASKTANPIATGTFYIGASLAVGTAAAQTAGVYTSTAFDVTVTYE